MSDVEPAPAPVATGPAAPGTTLVLVLCGLAGTHVAAALASGHAVAIAVDTALACLLAGIAASSRLNRPVPEAIVVGVLMGSAVAAALRVELTGELALGAGVGLSLTGALAVRGTRGAQVLVATGIGAFAPAAATTAVRTHDWTAAGLAGAVVLATGGAVLALHHATTRSTRLAQTARRTADTLRVTDPLTGVLNRRGLELVAMTMIETSRRRGEAVHALFVDIDDFSLVNHEVGYGRGDDVLLAVAEALRGAVRTTDVVCRAGGDEFVVLGPGTGTSPLEMERRLRALLQAAPPISASIWDSRLSIGSATLVPWDDGDLGSLLARADQDMRLRRSLRRQSQDRRGDVGTTAARTPPRTEV